MSIPLLSYSYKSQNQRVASFEAGSEESPKIYNADNLLSNAEIDNLIRSAYVQIFNEQQLIKSNRQTFLESQLRNRQITVRDFIKGLLLSDSFRRRNYEVNNNYRFVEMCIQRVLGREVYDQKEKLAWSIVLATKGINGFVDSLLNTQEYLDNFGEDIVPYQRRRILPGRELGNVSFAHMPRYGADYRAKLEAMGYFRDTERYYGSILKWNGKMPPEIVGKIGAVLIVAGAIEVLRVFIIIALSAFSTGSF